MDADLSQLTDQEVKDRLAMLSTEEAAVSKRRRELHTEIDTLRAELVNRLRTRMDPLGEDAD